MRRAVAVLFLVAVPAVALSSGGHVHGCNTTRCDRAVVKACRESPTCAARVRRKAERREWRRYRARPMPSCTWRDESGDASVAEFALSRYGQMNPTSTAGGKFQMLDGTFHAYGGEDVAGVTHDAARVRPIVQERIGRRVAYSGYGATPPQGLGAWARC